MNREPTACTVNAPLVQRRVSSQLATTYLGKGNLRRLLFCYANSTAISTIAPFMWPKYSCGVGMAIDHLCIVRRLR